MQKSKPEEAAQLSNHEFGVMVERAKNGDNEALVRVLVEIQPEIDNLARFLKLPKEEGVQEITTQFIEKIRG
ncbi:helix-turn-helix domain-containing protein [Brevibacillus gelatini]|uniref:helix-turn-helix domain-containing protein n=1 Tax=Brevibacillus gelatini TaxID=1655277 RepID=UPI0011CDCEE3|nr:helix-turn-helix domain-containing protein [Brevibacillus gelatini]